MVRPTNFTSLKEINIYFGSLQAITPRCSTKMKLENEVASKAYSLDFEEPC
jgi:hypothetical protein